MVWNKSGTGLSDGAGQWNVRMSWGIAAHANGFSDQY